MFEAIKNRLPRGFLLGKVAKTFGYGAEVRSALRDGDENGANNLVRPDFSGNPKNETGSSCQSHQGFGMWKGAGERNDGFWNLHRNAALASLLPVKLKIHFI